MRGTIGRYGRIERLVSLGNDHLPEQLDESLLGIDLEQRFFDTKRRRVLYVGQRRTAMMSPVINPSAAGPAAMIQTVGGVPSPILRANGLFRAVALPAGSHEVVFEYWPVSFFVGWAIALIALSLTAVAGMARLFRS